MICLYEGHVKFTVLAIFKDTVNGNYSHLYNGSLELTTPPNRISFLSLLLLFPAAIILLTTSGS